MVFVWGYFLFGCGETTLFFSFYLLLFGSTSIAFSTASFLLSVVSFFSLLTISYAYILNTILISEWLPWQSLSTLIGLDQCFGTCGASCNSKQDSLFSRGPRHKETRTFYVLNEELVSILDFTEYYT